MRLPAYEIKRIIEVCSSGLYSAGELLSASETIWRRHRALRCLEVIRCLTEPRSEGSVSSFSLLDPYRRDVEEKLAWRDKIIEEAAPDILLFR